MDALAGTAYLLPFMLVLFWVGSAISKFVTKTALSQKDTLIAFGISWAISSIPQLLFGIGVYKIVSEIIVVPAGSFLVTYIMRNKGKNRELDQYVDLRSKGTQEVRRIKIGFSCPCFFFSFFFGLPLFLRKLNVWGGVVASIDILYIILNTSESLKARNAAFIIFLSIIGLSIFLGFKANEMTGKYLIESGWEFEVNENSNVAMAKEKWLLG